MTTMTATTTTNAPAVTPADLREMARLVARDVAAAWWDDGGTPGWRTAEGETEWEGGDRHAILTWRARWRAAASPDPADDTDGCAAVNVWAADAVAWDDDDEPHDITAAIDLGRLSQLASMMA